ncbi:hypothetical protein, partial [Microbulbifer sp. 2205BS26-8]|uniref:hypothetical protein n=1 Tax=Microbulbifer sp. 2205BS26-8 TaxID=3064386 RepID=UPI00273D48EB
MMPADALTPIEKNMRGKRHKTMKIGRREIILNENPKFILENTERKSINQRITVTLKAVFAA